MKQLQCLKYWVIATSTKFNEVFQLAWPCSVTCLYVIYSGRKLSMLQVLAEASSHGICCCSFCFNICCCSGRHCHCVISSSLQVKPVSDVFEVCLGSSWGGFKLVVEKWNCWCESCNSATCCRHLETFFRQGGLNSMLASVLCSLILLKEKVQWEIARSVVDQGLMLIKRITADMFVLKKTERVHFITSLNCWRHEEVVLPCGIGFAIFLR